MGLCVSTRVIPRALQLWVTRACPRPKRGLSVACQCSAGSWLFFFFFLKSVLLHLLCEAGLIFDSQTVTQNDTGWHLPLETARPGSASRVGSKACQPADTVPASGCPGPSHAPLASPMSNLTAERPQAAAAQDGCLGPSSRFYSMPYFPRVLPLGLCPQASALL